LPRNAKERGRGPESSFDPAPDHASSEWRINGLTLIYICAYICATVKPDLRFRFLMV